MPSPEARHAVFHNLDLVDPPVDEIELDRSIKILGRGAFILRSCRLDEFISFNLGWTEPPRTTR